MGSVKTQIERVDIDCQSQALDHPLQFVGIFVGKLAAADMIFFVNVPETQIWNLYELYPNDYFDASLRNYSQLVEKVHVLKSD